MTKARNPKSSALGSEARSLVPIIARYSEPSLGRSLFEILFTAGALVSAWILMWVFLDVTYWLTLLMAVPTAGFLARLFMIQHDCGHGAYFRHRRANDWVGRVLGVLTLTPYDSWRQSHAIHHATTGNLDRRGIGDIETLTVREYLARSWIGRLGYRLYRHPLIMFGLGPAYLFILQHRLPIGLMRAGWRPWVSTMLTNGAVALLAVPMIWFFGIGPFLLVNVPIILFAASIGVWLFYVQHQFEGAVWAPSTRWNLHYSALHGSSYYDLPCILRWFTANIGMHHVHHLCSRVPFYRLSEVMRDNPQLGNIGRVTLLQSLSSIRLTLWDETRQRLISFSEIVKSSSETVGGKLAAGLT
jgi:omega-6 fatty acid desaturase (delta-12 desaturase)